MQSWDQETGAWGKTLASTLGLCNALQGRADDARERQRRALELDGDNPEIRRISDEIDRILGAGGGPSREELGGLLLMLIAGVMGRTKKEPGSC